MADVRHDDRYALGPGMGDGIVVASPVMCVCPRRRRARWGLPGRSLRRVLTTLLIYCLASQH